MKKIILAFVLTLSLFGDDIVVFDNEYNVLELDKRVKKLIVGNKEMINVSLLSQSTKSGTLLKIFGKKSGNTSMLIIYRDGSIENYHVYVNENLGFIQKMINHIEPNLSLSKVGNGSTVLAGTFKDPHDKKRIYSLLENAGIDLNRLMDLTKTKKVNKMLRTKLYLVEINNNKAEDMGGVTGLGFFSQYIDATINPLAANSATFSGWLLDNAAGFTSTKNNSVAGTLNFLAESGIGKILDDTVLMTTEDENASFRVGGEVYIPKSMTQNTGTTPTIQVEEREYGLELSLTGRLMEKDGFMHINVDIHDSEFDTNTDHDVALGDGVVIPSFTSKNITTNVVVKSGQVLVLGGRLHTEDTETEEKVPFLGDIPLLGELFKHTVSGTKNNDLLFFLVPEIVDANEEIDDTLYYKELQDTSKKFYKDALETNTTEEEPLVLVEATDSLNDEPMAIEVEDVSLENAKDEINIVQEQEKNSKLLNYSVNAQRIFLRSKPIDGEVLAVWKKGHPFNSMQEKTVNGKVWMRIYEDCLNSCQTTKQALWISKKYTK